MELVKRCITCYRVGWDTFSLFLYIFYQTIYTFHNDAIFPKWKIGILMSSKMKNTKYFLAHDSLEITKNRWILHFAQNSHGRLLFHLERSVGVYSNKRVFKTIRNGLWKYIAHNELCRLDIYSPNIFSDHDLNVCHTLFNSVMKQKYSRKYK